jgi:hypothetical protein
MRNGHAQDARADASDERSTQSSASVLTSSDTIEQVRELLFGHEKRKTESDLSELRAELAASVEALRAEMRQNVDMLTSRLIDLDKTTETRRLESIGDIGRAISDLGARIQNMGSDKSRR